MATEPSSPKRRHILSSINPERPPISSGDEERRGSSEVPAGTPRDDGEDKSGKVDNAHESTERKTSKFRFKSKHSRSHRSSRHSNRDRDRDRDRDHERSNPRSDCEPDNDDEHTSSRHHSKHEGEEPRRHRHHHHHHRRKRRRRTRSASPEPQNPFNPPPLDSEAAFRESLFDAMADDEGAAYWEGVYGQPIHVYSQERERAVGPDGELERMDDDEYAAHVRQRMWEKTHQGLLEERARREEARRQKEQGAEEAARLTREMERSLRRGEERRARRSWNDRWRAYVEAWEGWNGTPEGIAWPVRGGRRDDALDPATVREFYVMGIDPTEVGESGYLARLKEERVRWHPDKIQQRLGGRVDEAIMRDVTAVFQIVDKLWTDTRSKPTAGA